MKKNNKGFTLIEVITVIAILLIFTIIALPNIGSLINKNDDKKREIVKQSIIDAASTYCDFYDCEEQISVTTLISENLLDEDELKEYYSNVSECYVEKSSGDYTLKNCNSK